MKKLAFLLFCSLFLISGVSDISDVLNVSAAPNDVLIDEDFRTRTMINEEQTNAIVDTQKGEVRLPKVSGAQSMDVNNEGLLVLNENGLQFYSYDGQEYLMNPYLSHSFSGNPIAAVLSPEGYDHYILDDENSMTTYRFSNGLLHDDPSYTLSGFSSAVSIARSEDSFFVLDDRQVRVFKDTGTGFVEAPQLRILLDNVDNPIQLATMGEDVVVLDENENIHYFSHQTTFYEKDPSLSFFGSGTAIDGQDGTAYTIRENQVTGYSFTSTSLVRNEYLSFGHAGAVSVGGLEEDLSVLVRDESGITHYTFNGSTMVPTSGIDGLSSPPGGYQSPRELNTLDYAWIEETERIYVEATDDLSPDTEMNISVSADGGVTFLSVDGSGIVQFDSPTNAIRIKVELATSSGIATPVLHHIKVIDKSLNIDYLETTRIIREPEGNSVLPTRDPVQVMGGYNFDMRVEAPGADEVVIQFSNGESLSLFDEGDSIFTGTHFFASDAEGVFDVLVVARDSSDNEVQLLLPAHYLVPDNIQNNIRVYDLR